MMCVASGMERSLDEYYDLLQQCGWKYNQTYREKQQDGSIQVIEVTNFQI
jgi:hypothetical protein